VPIDSLYSGLKPSSPVSGNKSHATNSPLEIVSAIGKGGKGQVWKARDPGLRQDLAIKVRRASSTGSLGEKHPCLQLRNRNHINERIGEYYAETPLHGAV
jgi:hypothetical protein